MRRVKLTAFVTLPLIFALTACASEAEAFTPTRSYTSEVQHVVTDTQYVEIPGVTYKCTNENLTKYLYVMKEGETYYIYGEGVHLGKLQPSMTLDEVLVKGETLLYENSAGTLSATISDSTVTLQDHRTGVAMPMTGVYNLCKTRSHVTAQASSNETVSSVDATEVTWDALETDVNHDWVERQDYTMKVQFLENLSHNGMKFRLEDGTIIYVFGGSMSEPDAWMSIEATYRGSEKHFNGYDFGGTAEQCFVLKRRIKE